jgi:DNA (cytosine-5)-methyltransferase 1
MLRVVELFAGIGAWGKAMENLKIDHKVVQAVEFDEKTIKSYNIIHGTDFKPSDITAINPKDIPNCDLIFYSPPCQAFSIAGRQDGFSDPRGTLFFDAFNIIKEKRPKYAIMENVKNLTGKNFRTEFNTMLHMLELEGYRNYWKVLNAKDYGIPQHRERVFIVSIRDDQEFSFPTAFDSGMRLKHILEENVDARYYISNEKAKSLLEALIQRERADDSPRELSFDGEGISYCIDANYSKGISAAFVNSGRRTHVVETSNSIKQVGMLDIKGNEQIRRVYDPDGISPTLSTMQGGNRQPKIIQIGMVGDSGYEQNRRVYSSEGLSPTISARDYKDAKKVYHECRIRKLTPLECMRLMGFDDEDYLRLKENNISNSQIYKMAGNSIVVDVIENILKSLIVD